MTTAAHDVAIVGAGPAGTSLALHLVRAEGLRPDRIVVLDRARFPRDKPCGGAVSDHGLAALRAVGVTIDVPHVRLRGARVLTPRGVAESTASMGIVVRRSELDARLVAETRRAGVDVRDGDGLVDCLRGPSTFRLTCASGAVVTARHVAACDGAAGPTRRLLGVREVARKGHLYVTETGAAPFDAGPARSFADFDFAVGDDGIEGYYWDFPVLVADGGLRVNRGIYHANVSSGAELKEALRRALARRGLDLETVRIRAYSTRPFVRASPLFVGGVFLVGEAAGIDRVTGEGIAQAIVMGALAARHIARALRLGAADGVAYARAVRSSTVGRHMLQSAWLAPRAYGRLRGPAVGLLARSEVARQAVMAWYRGERASAGTLARLSAGLIASHGREVLGRRRR